MTLITGANGQLCTDKKPGYNLKKAKIEKKLRLAG